MDLRHARRFVIAVIGATVILFGFIMLVTPGPGIAAILLGLAVLGTEFLWARRLLKRARDHAGDAHEGLKIMCRQWWEQRRGYRIVSAPAYGNPTAVDKCRTAPLKTRLPPRRDS